MAEQLGHGAEQVLRTYGHVIADYRDLQLIDADAEIRAARRAGTEADARGQISVV